MQYVNQSLGPGEKIIHIGRFHWFYTASAYGWVALSFFGALAVIGFAVYFDIHSSIPERFKGTDNYDKAWQAVKLDNGGYLQIAKDLAVGVKVFAFLVFLSGIYMFSRMMVVKASTEIAITNKRLIYKVGLVARSVGEIDVQRIEGVNVIQGVLGRILGYGNLIIRGTGVGEVFLPPISNPITFRKAIDYSRYKGNQENRDLRD